MDNIRRLRLIRRAQHKRARMIKRNLRDTSDPFKISDVLFLKKYRVTKNLFRYILEEEVKPLIIPTQRNTSIPLELKLLSCLSFLATGSYQTLVGGERDISISQPSVSRYHSVIINAINILMERFYRKFRMPGVIGCIDGTHVAIICPKEHEEAFFCRKRYHSINAAIICDSNLKIIGINAKFGGAAHDSYVWQNMSLSQYIQRLHEQGESGWLLGDSGYPLRPWLMTPILNTEAGTPEAHYTYIHVRTRVTVERCIGVLKGRWRCLLRARTLHYEPEMCAKIINACAVLHNLCINANVDLPDDPVLAPEENIVHNFINNNAEDGRGRNELVQQLWINRH